MSLEYMGYHLQLHEETASTSRLTLLALRAKVLGWRARAARCSRLTVTSRHARETPTTL